MVHADRHPHHRVDDIDRLILGLATEGAQLAERLQVINHASNQGFSGVESPCWVRSTPLRLAAVSQASDADRAGERFGAPGMGCPAHRIITRRA